MSTTTSESQSLYSQGIAAYRAASYDTAIELFSQAIEIDSNNAKYHDARASAYEKLGKLQDGLLDARQVIRLFPTISKGYLRAARLLKQAKKYANAEKLLVQASDKVSKKDEKGIVEIQKELSTLQDLRINAEFCPFSNLPTEIFVEIISLATSPPLCNRYNASEISRSRPPRSNPLVSAMRVCRNWCRIIKGSPQFWQTLRLDGIINSKTAEKKTRLYLQRALGQGEGEKDSRKIRKPMIRMSNLDGSTTALGVQRLIITSAQDIPSPAFTSMLEQLRDAGVTSILREVVLSFVDGSRTTISNEREATIATELLVFLYTHSRDCLTSLSICSGGRCYPDFNLTSIYLAFPNLTTFNIWGNTTSNFVSSLRAPFLLNTGSSTSSNDTSPSPDVEESPPPPPPTPTNARSLTVTGSVLVADSLCRLSSFPHLTSLELDLIGASIIWELLSAPNLSKFHAVIYGENHILLPPLPDLAASWAKVQDLRIGGAKYLPARFINHAISLDLHFHHLTSLDLSFSSLSSRHLALFDSSRAPSLQNLNLASTTTAPTESSLVLPQLDSLKSLNVSHTLWTKDETIRGLISKCPKLEKLAVVGNAFITGRPVMELVLSRMPAVEEGKEKEKRWSEMRELKLEGCDKLETEAVEWLRKNTRPAVVKFQFVDPNDRRKGKW